MYKNKPTKPIKPEPQNYPQSKEPTHYNYLNEPIYGRPLFIEAYRKWEKDLIQYEKDLEEWEQTRMINDIIKLGLKYALKKYKITKR